MESMLLFKATVLLSLALVAGRLLRGAPAAARHWLWSLAFVALLALPLLALTLPAVAVPIPAWSRAAAAPPAGERTDAGVRVTSQDPSPRAAATVAVAADRGQLGGGDIASQPQRLAPSRLIPVLLGSVWLIGALTALGALLLSLLRVWWLARTAADLDDPVWRRAGAELALRLGLRRAPRLLVSDSVRMPMAGGLWRPTIFLPAAALNWQAERRDVVLAHEIAHIAGHDPLRHAAARLALGLYWFHPLAWMAARRSYVAREQACDEAVLGLGTRASAYAQVLLDLAESAHAPGPTLAALPMVERSLLEVRLMAILTHQTRPAWRLRLLAPAIVVAVVALPLAVAQPVVRVSLDQVTPLYDAAASASPRPLAIATPSAAPRPAVEPADSEPTEGALASPQAGTTGGSSCSWELRDSGGFKGSISMSQSGGRTVVNQQIGTRGSDHIIQQRLDDLGVCMVAQGVGDSDEDAPPSRWLDRARHVAMESRRGSEVLQLDVDRTGGGAAKTTWRVGPTERPFDQGAQQWRDRMLALLDISWELSSLRGEVSSLRGEISSIHGEESSLRGEISSLHGEVSSMQGRASSVRGEASSRRGQISSIQGHVNSLHGSISSERGAISSLNAGRYSDDAATRARIAQHEKEIARLEQEIKDYNADARIASVEKEIEALNDGKVAAIEAEIKAFDLEGKVAAIERGIADLDVKGKVAAIETQIAGLNADRRGRQLEERRDAALAQLKSVIGAIR